MSRQVSRAAEVTASEPRRLLRSGAPSADLLRLYAKRTTPGDRDGVAAWYRLRLRLESDVDAAPASRLRLWRWKNAGSWCRVLTFALAPIPVATNPHVDGPERALIGSTVDHLGGQQDHSGTGAQDRHSGTEKVQQRIEQPRLF